MAFWFKYNNVCIANIDYFILYFLSFVEDYRLVLLLIGQLTNSLKMKKKKEGGSFQQKTSSTNTEIKNISIFWI